MKLTKNQSVLIQILRGIAILAVVIIHCTPMGLMQVFVRPFVNFSVGMFLFLSGLLSNREKWNPLKRILKVLIPYAIWTLVYVILNNYKTPLSIPLAYVKGFLKADTAAVMYYVFVYIQFTLLIPLFDLLSKSKLKYLGFVLTPLEIIVMRLLPILFGFTLPSVVSVLANVSFVGWTTYFYLGYLIGNGRLTIRLKPMACLIGLMVSLALQIGEAYWYYSMGVENCGTQLKLSTVLTGAFVMLLAYHFICADKEVKLVPFKLLGDYSFGIFFLHCAIITILNKIPHYAGIAIFPLNVVFTLGISLGLVMLGRKIFGKFGKYLAL